MTFAMKSIGAQAKDRDGRIPVITDEAGIQDKLNSLKMPTSIRYEWDDTTLVVTDTEYNTVTRWKFWYSCKLFNYEQVGKALNNGAAMTANEWRLSHLWRTHSVALVVLTRWHQDEVFEHLS